MTARPIRRNAQTPDRNGKIFYTSTTSLSHISKKPGHEAVYGEIDVIKSERKSTIQTEPAVRSRNIVETQGFCYNGCRTLDDGKRDGKPMNISYQPLWNTLKERGMRKEDLRLAAGLTTNMIANMGKGKNISMETLVRICEALNCGILDVIELEQDKDAEKLN